MNTKNNKIIAEFMGWEIKNYSTPISDVITPYGQLNENQLKFHKDWNWLMEVVEKIEGLKYWTCLTGSLFEIGMIGSSEAIMFHAGSLKNETKIEAVYNACVEFIKWYNEQNK